MILLDEYVQITKSINCKSFSFVTDAIQDTMMISALAGCL